MHGDIFSHQSQRDVGCLLARLSTCIAFSKKSCLVRGRRNGGACVVKTMNVCDIVFDVNGVNEPEMHILWSVFVLPTASGSPSF